MKDLAIYGAGGLGREVAASLKYLRDSEGNPEWRLIGFFDDGRQPGEPVSHFGKVLGGLKELNAWPEAINVVIAIGSPKALKFISENVVNPNVNWPNIVSREFHVTDNETFSIGQGNLVMGYLSVTTNVRIGDFNIFNADIVLGHDAQIGSYNVVMPGVRISGGVTIGDCNMLGVKSLVLQGLKIGHGVTLGAGAVLLTKPRDNATYLGNPAKLFKY